MQELDDEALGWFSRRLPWGSYGTLARAHQLRRWGGAQALVPPPRPADAGHLAPLQEAGRQRHRAASRAPVSAFAEFCPVSVLRNIHGLACWFIDSRIPLQGPSSVARPAHHDAYAVLFPRAGPPVWTLLAAVLDARYLQRSCAAARRSRTAPDAATRPAADGVAVLARLPAGRACALLTPDPAAGHSRGAGIALRICRRARCTASLKDEGRIRCRGLKDEVQRERAMDLLHRTERPIKQVAYEAAWQ